MVRRVTGICLTSRTGVLAGRKERFAREETDMTYVDWKLRGPQIATCNCDWGCPCQFSSLPTHGNCRAAVAMRIDQGHFGEVSLDSLAWAGVYAWPGAIHEGNGEALPIIDVRATPEQRDALLTILSGKEQEPGATYFNVFASTITKVNTPLFLPIEFEANIAAGTGRFAVPGVVSSSAEPIRNPVTGAEHRVTLSLPNGFEFIEAEFANSTTKATGAIPLDWAGRHGHLALINIGPHGPVRERAA
jgi:hypothetical protein